jgi:hypothetical protein
VETDVSLHSPSPGIQAAQKKGPLNQHLILMKTQPSALSFQEFMTLFSDNNFSWALAPNQNKIVIPTGAKRSAEPALSEVEGGSAVLSIKTFLR